MSIAWLTGAARPVPASLGQAELGAAELSAIMKFPTLEGSAIT